MNHFYLKNIIYTETIKAKAALHTSPMELGGGGGGRNRHRNL
jgi:hypothetical protein